MHDRRRGGPRRHKDLQLCRQVFDALTYALADLDDPLVAGLALADVRPAPTAARVLVTLVATDPLVDRPTALASLREHADDLREEVAAEIARRRVPELVFEIEIAELSN